MKYKDYVYMVLLGVVQVCIRFLGFIGNRAPRRIQKRLARIQLWLFERKQDIWWKICELHPASNAWQVVYDLDAVHDRLIRQYFEI